MKASVYLVAPTGILSRVSCWETLRAARGEARWMNRSRDVGLFVAGRRGLDGQKMHFDSMDMKSKGKR